MCILSNLCFSLDKKLNLPPLSTSRLKCVLYDEENNIENLQVNLLIFSLFFDILEFLLSIFHCYCFQETFVKKDLIYPFATTPLSNVFVSSAKVLCEGDGVKTTIEIIFDISVIILLLI